MPRGRPQQLLTEEGSRRAVAIAQFDGAACCQVCGMGSDEGDGQLGGGRAVVGFRCVSDFNVLQLHISMWNLTISWHRSSENELPPSYIAEIVLLSEL